MLLLGLMLLAGAAAGISQEDAGTVCSQYSLESEIVGISGPILCEGSYWVCKFTYYGNDQNAMIAVKSDGGVLERNSDLLRGVIYAQHAAGGEPVMTTFLSDRSFAIQMAGMNNTLQNYDAVLKSLWEGGYIEKALYLDFRDRINSLGEQAFRLSQAAERLYNESRDARSPPDCAALASYLNDLNSTIPLAENFTTSWLEFVNRYNSLAGSVNTYVATMGSSDVQLAAQSLATAKAYLSAYLKGRDERADTIIGNLGTRFDRKDTRDKLDQAYGIVKDSQNPNATRKYNEAVAAFSAGKNSEARMLANEAILLAPIVPNGGETPDSKPLDLTPYIIALIALLVLLVGLRMRRYGVIFEGTAGKAEAAAAARKEISQKRDIGQKKATGPQPIPETKPAKWWEK